jgi:hypothetical protein
MVMLLIIETRQPPMLPGPGQYLWQAIPDTSRHSVPISAMAIKDTTKHDSLTLFLTTKPLQRNNLNGSRHCDSKLELVGNGFHKIHR